MRSRRGWVCGVVAALAAAVAPAAAAAGPPSWLVVEDGITQPVFSLDDAIEETLYVETTVDSDHDGRRDRVRIRISRRARRRQGYKVPVVFEHSPYRGDFGVPRTTRSTSSHAPGVPPAPTATRSEAAARAARAR